MTFMVLNELNIFKEAQALIMFNYKNDSYLLYMVKDYNEDNYNVMVSYIKRSSNKYYYLEKIVSKNKIFEIRKKVNYIFGGECDE